MDEIMVLILAAGGNAAAFCSRPEIWPLFEDYLRKDLDGELNETVNREFMSIAATVMEQVIQGIEKESVLEGFATLLSGS